MSLYERLVSMQHPPGSPARTPLHKTPPCRPPANAPSMPSQAPRSRRQRHAWDLNADVEPDSSVDQASPDSPMGSAFPTSTSQQKGQGPTLQTSLIVVEADFEAPKKQAIGGPMARRVGALSAPGNATERYALPAGAVLTAGTQPEIAWTRLAALSAPFPDALSPPLTTFPFRPPPTEATLSEGVTQLLSRRLHLQRAHRRQTQGMPAAPLVSLQQPARECFEFPARAMNRPGCTDGVPALLPQSVVGTAALGIPAWGTYQQPPHRYRAHPVTGVPSSLLHRLHAHHQPRCALQPILPGLPADLPQRPCPEFLLNANSNKYPGLPDHSVRQIGAPPFGQLSVSGLSSGQDSASGFSPSGQHSLTSRPKRKWGECGSPSTQQQYAAVLPPKRLTNARSSPELQQFRGALAAVRLTTAASLPDLPGLPELPGLVSQGSHTQVDPPAVADLAPRGPTNSEPELAVPAQRAEVRAQVQRVPAGLDILLTLAAACDSAASSQPHASSQPSAEKILRTSNARNHAATQMWKAQNPESTTERGALSLLHKGGVDEQPAKRGISFESDTEEDLISGIEETAERGPVTPELSLQTEGSKEPLNDIMRCDEHLTDSEPSRSSGREHGPDKRAPLRQGPTIFGVQLIP